MKGLDFGRVALTTGVGVALLAGCGGSQPPIGAPGATPQSRTIATHAKRGESWMLPEAKSQDLLYVSDGAVHVYSYPDGRKLGELAGSEARGLCSNSQGDVWIGEAGEVIEYAHGGTTPIKTLSDPGAYEGNTITSCSVDPISGDLAVVNFGDFGSSSPGNIVIFRDASSSPQIFCCELFPISGAYDSQGNFFAWGRRNGNTHKVVIARLGPNAAKFTLLRFHQRVAIASPGGLQWDGRHVVVSSLSGSSYASILYQFSIKNNEANRVGKVQLQDSFGIGEFWIHEGKVSAANWAGTTAMIWRYPHSGSPITTISGLKYPYGITVSVASGH